LLQVSGGVGTIIGFVHDWANPGKYPPKLGHGRALRDPEINGYVKGLRGSAKIPDREFARCSSVRVRP